MLSEAAIKWLQSIDYQKFSHEKRMILLKAAMIAYPNKKDDEKEEN